MNRDSNVYTVVYASVMVILVAVVLAFTSQSLSSLQKTNEENDKRQQILRSINIEAKNDAAEKYNQYIKDAFLVNENGVRVEGDAFEMESVRAFSDKVFPVFVAEINGETKYIMAMYGAGLWGPLWGYISVDDDKNTIYGADFSHQGETPGLGAEITRGDFSYQFHGKKLFRENGFKSIAIVKPGKVDPQRDFVDGISGGTITSQGVENMLHDSLSGYISFLTSQNQ